MSAPKLIINKFEGGTNFKTLAITFQTEDISTDVKFGEWKDGTPIDNKKNDERSARLVVKIVSGQHNSTLDLDLCAKELENNLDTCIKNNSCFDPPKIFENTMNNCSNLNYPEENKEIYNYNSILNEDGQLLTFPNETNTQNCNIEIESCLNLYNDNTESNENETSFINTINPLEQSLEKVRDNNARIMKNIQLLNKIIYYTKNKETLNIFPKSSRTFPCNTCGKCFVYETGLRRHYSLRHTITKIQPRWQVVWTCVQCFQVWPKQQQAIIHSSKCCQSENSDLVKEIKTSSLLQCEFCERIFTSIPRLLRHAKIHTTWKNYECNACSIAFLSYKTAEQHWISCSWLKMYYCFSLPKLLLCNVCDRKFRNYDQLYNHRYKVGHFITKTHCTDGNAKALGILVYQCELCGQWFTAIPMLNFHKSQCANRETNVTEFVG